MDRLPDDIETLRAIVVVVQARADVAEAEAARLVAQASAAEADLLTLRLENAKLRRELYGQRSERTVRLLDQLELEFEEAEPTPSQGDLAAERAAAKTTTVRAFSRARPRRLPLPEHLPRERVVVPSPTECPCCGSQKLCNLGETVSETLESVPRQWKVIQTVREKFTCRDCEKGGREYRPPRLRRRQRVKRAGGQPAASPLPCHSARPVRP